MGSVIAMVITVFFYSTFWKVLVCFLQIVRYFKGHRPKPNRMWQEKIL